MLKRRLSRGAPRWHVDASSITVCGGESGDCGDPTRRPKLHAKPPGSVGVVGASRVITKSHTGHTEGAEPSCSCVNL